MTFAHTSSANRDFFFFIILCLINTLTYFNCLRQFYRINLHAAWWENFYYKAYKDTQMKANDITKLTTKLKKANPQHRNKTY